MFFYLLACHRYYEVDIQTEGPAKVGWCLVSCPPDGEVGSDDHSWSYDGHSEEKLHGGYCDSYGKRWQPGDVVGVFLDIPNHTISKKRSKI